MQPISRHWFRRAVQTRTLRHKLRNRISTMERLEERTVFAAGELDTTFGIEGIVRTQFRESATYGTSVKGTVIQADGRVVAAGEGGMARFNTDGSVDTSFGIEGRVAPPLYARAIAVQADGKLLVAGGTAQYNSTDMLVARYLSSGELDTTFDGDGVATIDFGGNSEWATSLLVEPNGRIVVAGGARESVAIARLLTTGQLDTSFDTDGKQSRQFTRSDIAYGLARQANGRILVVGTSWVNFSFNNIDYDMFALRINTNGTVDGSFDGDGIAHANFTSSIYSRDEGRGIAVQADGRIVISGSVYGNFSQFTGVARFNTNGTLDQAFGTEGRVRVPVNHDIAAGTVDVLDDQRLVVTNYQSVMRFTTAGTLDPTFDGDGIAITNGLVNSASRQADGAIVVGGTVLNVFGVRRLTADGAIDATYSLDGAAIAPMGNSNDTATSSLIQANGRVVVVGSSQLGFAAARYLSNGQLDTSFSGDGLQVVDFGGMFSEVLATGVTQQSDGKIVMTGWGRELSNLFSYSRMVVVRFNVDGSLDTSFSGDGWQVTELGGYSEANAVLVQPDGKILIGGKFDDRATLVRYLPDGTLDNTFSGDGVVSMQTVGSTIASLVLQPDGRILAGGYMLSPAFTMSTYGTVLMVARFKSNGALDPSFGINGRMVDPGNLIRNADDIVLLGDGSFVVTGDTSRYVQNSESSKIAVSQYDSTGAPIGPLGTRVFTETESYSFSDFETYATNSWATSLHRQSDGKLIVVGYTPTRMVIRRINADGVIDSTFSGDGVVAVGLPSEQWRATDVVQQADGRLVVSGFARAASPNGFENDFVVLRLQNQAVGAVSTKVAFNAQGNVEITDLWGRDDRFDLIRTSDAIVITENSADTSSQFQVISLPGVTGNGTRQVTIPLSVIEATGKPLVINTLAGDDQLIVDPNFDGPLTGLSYRSGLGIDKLSLANHNMAISWSLSAATTGSARPVGRIPITFNGTEHLAGGQNVDNFNLTFQGSSDRLMIDGGGFATDAVTLTADANMEFTSQILAGYGQRLIADDGRRQEYSIKNIEQVSLRGGVGNNRIDARNLQARATLRGGDGDDVLIGPRQVAIRMFGDNGNDLLFGGAEDDLMYGGAGHDLLFGDSGVDQLYGEDGRDVLVGDYSPDFLFGGASEDIIVGGIFLSMGLGSLDNPTARDAILATWRSSASYATRIDLLTNVGVGPDNSIKITKDVNVFTEGYSDSYYGNAGLDWFIADLPSESDLRDRIASEQVFDV